MLSLRGLPVYYLDGSGAVAIGEINDSRILKEFYQDFSLIIRLYQLVRMKVKIEELPQNYFMRRSQIFYLQFPIDSKVYRV